MNIAPETWKRLNGSATLVWLALVVPTLALWRESVPWIAFMSIWANVVGHLSAWVAGRAEVKADQR